MNRREFSCMMAGASAAAMLPSFLLSRQSPSSAYKVSEAAAELYKSALVLDCNSGPGLTQWHLPLPQADLDLVRDSGVSVVKWTIGGDGLDFADTVRQIAFIQQMTEVHAASFMQVRLPADMERAKREGKMGLILSFESADMLEGKLERIELFRNLGVRVMQFSYNRKSPFGSGVMESDAGGLTAMGRLAANRMNALGIAIDVSHANAQTTTDALAVSTKPVIMSHAGCAAVHAHPRSKTDDQLRALAGKGGVVGIYALPYLSASPKQPSVDDYMAHMEHALKVAGEDHVGVGSDVSLKPFDLSPQSLSEFKQFQEERKQSGVAAPEEDRPLYVEGLNIPRRIEMITDQLLKRGYSSRVAEKIIGANFARVFTEIWTTQS